MPADTRSRWLGAQTLSAHVFTIPIDQSEIDDVVAKLRVDHETQRILDPFDKVSSGFDAHAAAALAALTRTSTL